MTTPKTQVVGSLALGLSLLVFTIYFINVLIGGPLGQKPWLSDVGEMLTLLLAVVLFVVGTIAREAQVLSKTSEQRTKEADMNRLS